jgi:hypothetical protein
VSGRVPAGLTLNPSTGVLSGTPTAPALAKLTVSLTDSATPRIHHAKAHLVLQVAPIAVTISPATLPAGVHGVAYHGRLIATGGTHRYTFTQSAGTLPPGLVLKTTGAIVGKPTTPGTYGFDVTVTDKYGYSGTRTFTVVVS